MLGSAPPSVHAQNVSGPAESAGSGCCPSRDDAAVSGRQRMPPRTSPIGTADRAPAPTSAGAPTTLPLCDRRAVVADHPQNARAPVPEQVVNRLRTTSRMLGDAAVGARPRQQRRRVATTGGYLVANRGVSSARVQRPRAVRTRLSGCEDSLPSRPFVQRGAQVRVSQRNGTAGPPTIRLNVLLRRRPRW
jgi:hypothetical protein